MGVKVEYAALKRFRDNMEKLSREQIKRFSEDAVNELAMRLLAKVRKRTPVYTSIPDDVNAHPGGTLRQKWDVGNVIREGDAYYVDIINPVPYAIYVEYGHRGVYVPKIGKVLHVDKRWTEGRFMLTISEEELQKSAPRILQNKLKGFMEGINA